MPILTTEIDEDTYSEVADAARRDGTTVSERARLLIERGILGESALDAIRDLVGAIDDPTFEAPERPGPEISG